VLRHAIYPLSFFILLSLYVGGSWRVLAGPGGSYGSEKLSNLEVAPAALQETKNSAWPVLPYMKTKKNRIELAKKIISNLKREMQKQRLTESVRNKKDQAALIVKGVCPQKSRTLS
jgi:hypothetical protein